MKEQGKSGEQIYIWCNVSMILNISAKKKSVEDT